VTFTAVLGLGGAANGLNIDGSVKGALLFAVPVGWQVRIRCVNRAARPFACTVGGAPGGATPMQTRIASTPLISTGASATLAMRMTARGSYRVSAVTDGVAAAGMWVVFDAVDGGRPSARWLR
jgi:hypothetical protein